MPSQYRQGSGRVRLTSRRNEAIHRIFDWSSSSPCVRSGVTTFRRYLAGILASPSFLPIYAYTYSTAHSALPVATGSTALALERRSGFVGETSARLDTDACSNDCSIGSARGDAAAVVADRSRAGGPATVGVQDRVVGGLLLEIFVPSVCKEGISSFSLSLDCVFKYLRESTACARENSRHPRVLIREIPNGHTNAFLDLVAGSDGGGVVFRLLFIVLTCFGVLGADVELGDGDFEAKGGECFHVRDLIFERRAGSNDQVVLEANAVDLDAIGLHQLDDVQGCGRLGAWSFDGATED